jgi:hypothetical protein
MRDAVRTAAERVEIAVSLRAAKSPQPVRRLCRTANLIVSTIQYFRKAPRRAVDPPHERSCRLLNFPEISSNFRDTSLAPLLL